MLFLLMLVFGSCVSGHFQHEAEEGQDILLQWTSPRQLDLSLLTISCQLISSTTKMIDIKKGKRRIEEEAAQFSGRVQYDADALKQGQVELRLSLLQASDSGQYRCEMSAADTEQSWKFMFFEYFTITVLHRPAPTTKDKLTERPGDDLTQQPQNNDRTRMFLIIPFLTLFTATVVLVFLIVATKHTKHTNRTEESSDDTPESNYCLKLKDLATKRDIICPL
ncbi:hypothetical protein NQD34_018409 [Periophthalmus magnuspinnatus]|nr:hypothetical protein NQD34_018409 [Periophthalmus magnuspinnatus]